MRFYFQWHIDAWKVFDRNLSEKGGDHPPIAVCRSRHYAKLITESLNVEDKLRNQVA